uniref:hypothetical protein n=1 Tax=Streptomyces violascens TaxID=67381 RepID=UPI0027E3C718|nr:hypothetical protein [Streptomyces violascens]
MLHRATPAGVAALRELLGVPQQSTVVLYAPTVPRLQPQPAPPARPGAARPARSARSSSSLTAPTSPTGRR